jgi:hypothetical protein
MHPTPQPAHNLRLAHTHSTSCSALPVQATGQGQGLPASGLQRHCTGSGCSHDITGCGLLRCSRSRGAGCVLRRSLLLPVVLQPQVCGRAGAAGGWQGGALQRAGLLGEQRGGCLPCRCACTDRSDIPSSAACVDAATDTQPCSSISPACSRRCTHTAACPMAWCWLPGVSVHAALFWPCTGQLSVPRTLLHHKLRLTPLPFTGHSGCGRASRQCAAHVPGREAG